MKTEMINRIIKYFDTEIKLIDVPNYTYKGNGIFLECLGIDGAGNTYIIFFKIKNKFLTKEGNLKQIFFMEKDGCVYKKHNEKNKHVTKEKERLFLSKKYVVIPERCLKVMDYINFNISNYFRDKMGTQKTFSTLDNKEKLYLTLEKGENQGLSKALKSIKYYMIYDPCNLFKIDSEKFNLFEELIGNNKDRN